MPSRVALVGNHWTALIAAQSLAAEGALVATATPRLAHDANRTMADLARQRALPHALLDRETVGDDLNRWLATARPDSVFVVGCPYRIPAAQLDVAPRGFWNFHFGLLPRDRGPDPVFWQIRNRESVGGITCHHMDAELDHGPVIEARTLAIDAGDTYGLHVNRLATMLGAMVRDLARRLDGAGAPTDATPQDTATARHRSRPTSRDLMIDWSEDAGAIDALVRASNPVYGGAVALLRGVPVRVFEATPSSAPPTNVSASPRSTTAADVAPGTVIAAGARAGIDVCCGNGTMLRLSILATAEGVLSAERFAAAYRVAPGECFTTRPG